MTSPAIRIPRTPELVAMVAMFMALGALGIDIMLPALPEIAASFHVAHGNAQQLVILVYVLSVGVGQLVYGPLSDCYGRRPVLLISFALYLAATVACLVAPNFFTFLLARAMQGAAAAAARVIAVAVVRDLMAGREMARVMSIAMMVFMVAPILAPSVGQLVLLVGPWRWTFGFLFIMAAIVIAWTWFRLPETRPKELRAPFSIAEVARGYAAVLQNRTTLGYTVATMFLFGSMFGFLVTSQQVFVEVYGLGQLFPLAFGGVAAAMSLASFINSRLVTRLGMRRLSHGALLAFTAISLLHALLLTVFGAGPFWRYMLLLAPAMLMFGMIGANFSAIVMEPLGERAGVASSFYGFATTTFSALIGGLIGARYDGTAAPLIIGQACLGVIAISIIWLTERGRLFTTPAAV